MTRKQLYYRLESKNRPPLQVGKPLLVTTSLKDSMVVWNEWFGWEPVDVFQIEGSIIEDRKEDYFDDDDKLIAKIRAPIVRPTKISYITTWTYTKLNKMD